MTSERSIIVDAIFALLHDTGFPCSARFIEDALRPAEPLETDRADVGQLSSVEEIASMKSLIGSCGCPDDFACLKRSIEGKLSPTMRRTHEKIFLNAWLGVCLTPKDVSDVWVTFFGDQCSNETLYMIIRRMSEFPLRG